MVLVSSPVEALGAGVARTVGKIAARTPKTAVLRKAIVEIGDLVFEWEFWIKKKEAGREKILPSEPQSYLDRGEEIETL